MKQICLLSILGQSRVTGKMFLSNIIKGDSGVTQSSDAVRSTVQKAARGGRVTKSVGNGRPEKSFLGNGGSF